MSYEIQGTTVVVHREAIHKVEHHEFPTAEEARIRVQFIEECLSWVGTPFVDCAAIKGRKGGVDCVMMMARAAIDAGLKDEFDPRPYKPRHMLHSSEELFIKYLTEKLGAVEIPAPRLGDIVAWQFGKCFCHGAVLINSEEVVHATGSQGCVLTAKLTEPLLKFVTLGSRKFPRPIKYFNVWVH